MAHPVVYRALIAEFEHHVAADITRSAGDQPPSSFRPFSLSPTPIWSRPRYSAPRVQPLEDSGKGAVGCRQEFLRQSLACASAKYVSTRRRAHISLSTSCLGGSRPGRH
jgi:hypothetical protein